MKYTEQDLKDEYEQAIKRKGKLYAEGYIEGLKDAQTQALTITDVVVPKGTFYCMHRDVPSKDPTCDMVQCEYCKENPEQ